MPARKPPAGFVPLRHTSPFRKLVGPLYEKSAPNEYIVGIYVQAKHGNMRSLVHGGMLATLVDTAMGYAITQAKPGIRAMATTSLTVHYAGNAEVGKWIEARVDVQRVGRRVAFASCYVWCEANRIVQASAAFQILE